MKKQKGVSVVEFALVAPVYFLLIFGIIEFGLLFWSDLTMQYAVREGARYAITGQVNLDPNTSNQQRYRAIIQKMDDSSMGLWNKVNPTISVSLNGGPFQQYGSASSYNTGMFGNAGDIVTLQLNCSWPLTTALIGNFFSGGTGTFTVGATMRNEAFPS
ncbi:MAG: pilus assembly protein [Formivibrio sp.]|nr:pilus assembly protein [Formivibrio sp.]